MSPTGSWFFTFAECYSFVVERRKSASTERRLTLKVWSIALGSVAILFAYGAHAQLGSGLTLGGSERRVIDHDMQLTGAVTLRGRSELVIQDAEVLTTLRANETRVTIELFEDARLVLKHGTLHAPKEQLDALTIALHDRTTLHAEDSVLVARIEAADTATFVLRRSQVTSSALAVPEGEGTYGLIHACCNVRGNIEGSTVNAIELAFGASDRGEVKDLRAGHMTQWESKDIGSVGMDVRVVNTDILPPRDAPYDRGWNIAAPPQANLAVTDADLGLLTFTDIHDVPFTLSDLPLGHPADAHVDRLRLQQVTVHQAWGIALTNATATVSNVEGVALFPAGNGTILLRESTLRRFLPTVFTGSVIFDRAAWGGRATFRNGNRFRMAGTVRIDPELERHTTWADATVERVYPLPEGDASVTFTKATFNDTRDVEHPRTGRIVRVRFFDSTNGSGEQPANDRLRPSPIAITVLLLLAGAGGGAVLWIRTRQYRRTSPMWYVRHK
jgi:hypothetical protein